jgi:hypothetical protein
MMFLSASVSVVRPEPAGPIPRGGHEAHEAGQSMMDSGTGTEPGGGAGEGRVSGEGSSSVGRRGGSSGEQGYEMDGIGSVDRRVGKAWLGFAH